MNGVLGSFSTSNHDVTVQLMHKFLTMQSVSFDHWPEEFKQSIGPVLWPYLKEKGSVSETICPSNINFKPLPPLYEKAFDSDDELSKVERVIKSQQNRNDCTLEVLKLYKYASSIAIGNSIKLASANSKYSYCSKFFFRRCIV